MSLAEYRSKRDFGRTPEPSRRGRRGKILRFVVQKHAASRLHYDFRLETEGGVLKSWAVPKGISLDPEEKRLAVETEDHPLSYASFEGEIPAGNYGAGSVIIWDTGEYRSDRDIRQQLAEGKVKFELYGQKLRGSFSLVRMRGNMRQWLLIKARDRHASSKEVNALMPDSVLSGKGGQKGGKLDGQK